ncbi:hypothetical protein MNBD_UNCLBAC01-1740 [hydrothermal vent metagenome]|uniref:Eight transmembrane protein EpsH n=1 Tax=hydrothermal vent metagenome TaxID=652676 RepID=A0A3B1DUT0_9ZZZZ
MHIKIKKKHYTYSMFTIFPWLCVTILYSPIFYVLYKTRWEMINYTHAYYILPLALFITYLKYSHLKKDSKVPETRTIRIVSFLLLTFSLLLFIIGWREEYLFIQTITLIPLLFSLTTFLYNKRLTRTLIFPFCYLLLLIPIPIGILDNITLPMRHIISVLSANILTALNYPITREGLLITMGNHEIFMGAPCSGFRSLITMLSLGLVYIYFNKSKLWKNALLVFLIIPFSLFGNLIRVLALCLITYYFGEEAGKGFFHNFSGFVVFFIMISCLMLSEKLLNKK